MVLGMLFFLLALTPPIGMAQDVANTARPKIGLALSGGGAKGLAHIGALHVLEDIGMPIDMVTGTSMGSIVGGLYAIGYTPDELEELATTLDWNALFADRTPRRFRPLERRIQTDEFLFRLPIRGLQPTLPTGIVTGYQVSRLLTRLTLPAIGITDFRQFPIPFAAVAADLATGEAVRLEDGDLASAIRASIAIPGALTPLVIKDRTYIDGGMARNLPAEDVIAMGADFVVCVYVGFDLQPADSLTSLASILNQTLSFRGADSFAQQRSLCDVMIRPDMDDFTAGSFDEVEGLIAEGAKAAERARPDIERLIREAGSALYVRKRQPSQADTFYVRSMRITGISEEQATRVRRSLNQTFPSTLTSDDLEDIVNQVYSSELFDQVLYRLVATDKRNQYDLQLEATQRSDGQLGLNLRFDSRYQTAFQAQATLNNVVGLGSRLDAAVRLGDIPQLRATYALPLQLEPRIYFHAHSRFTRFPIEEFDGNDRVASFRSDVFELSGEVALFLANKFVFRGGIHTEIYSSDQSIGLDQFFSGFLSRDLGLWGFRSEIYHDSFDRSMFAKRGHQLQLAVTNSDKWYGSGATFTHYLLDWRGRWPVDQQLSLLTRLTLGRTVGQPPLHYRFYVGGAFSYEPFAGRQFPLYGYSTQQLSGRDLHAVSLGAQFEFTDVWIGTLLVNAAHLADRWTWTPSSNDFNIGAGASLGINTVLIPIEVVLTGSNDGPKLRLNVGYSF